ncbi:MAG TPA: FtsQ-type POTRA domain-containing protein [Bacteroidota bacterium]|nr:FtsQ-type POTRA domain-containing protein [Bacteroidota bacterium]
MAEEAFIGKHGEGHGKRVYAIFISLLVLVVAVWLGAMQWTDHLTVRGIVVEGEHIVTPDEIVKLTGISLNTKMYDVDLSSIQKNIARNNFIKKVTVTRDAPATIKVYVQERTPIALLLIPGRSDLLSVDEDGYVLPHVASQSIFDLPVISGLDSVSALSVGQRAPQPDILAAIDIITTAQKVSTELSHMISEVRIHSGHDIVLYSADTGVPIIFGRGDAARKLVTLDTFWKKFVADQGAQNIRYIDVRFDGQVVVSSKSGDQQIMKKAS